MGCAKGKGCCMIDQREGRKMSIFFNSFVVVALWWWQCGYCLRHAGILLGELCKRLIPETYFSFLLVEGERLLPLTLSAVAYHPLHPTGLFDALIEVVV